MNHGKVIAIAGNQSTCADILYAICKAGYKVNYLLHMDASHSEGIADYQELRPLAESLGVPVVHPSTYAMKDDASRRQFESLGIDLLISAGWQRLFPQWFLETLSIGAFGMHGSAEPLPKGRGRSPMNWSIIEGRDRFYTNLFKYDAGVDSGQIVDTQPFDITERDTIRSLRHKNTLSQIRLLLEHLPALLDGTAQTCPQPQDVTPTYYPKRTPEDGVVDWHEPVERIDRLVRAVSRPYPGAYTYCDGTCINVWGGAPFDASLRFDHAAPGTVVGAFHDGAFAVKTGDGTYFVSDWDSTDGWVPAEGCILRSEHNRSLEKLEAMYAQTAHEGFGFTRSQYSYLLDAFSDGGYECGFYDEPVTAERTLFLRHDVDKSPAMALEMAHMEHERGFHAAYFFMLRGGLYNVLEPETSETIKAIARLGHRIGLHCNLSRTPESPDDIDAAVTAELDLFRKAYPAEVGRMVTFHNPPSEVVNRAPRTNAYVSGYDPRFMLPETKYISESNAHWREGHPDEMIRSGTWPRLQILVHPMWWMWDKPLRTTEILARILKNRGEEQDLYLRSSNRLWQRFHEGIRS